MNEPVTKSISRVSPSNVSNARRGAFCEDEGHVLNGTLSTVGSLMLGLVLNILSLAGLLLQRNDKGHKKT